VYFGLGILKAGISREPMRLGLAFFNRSHFAFKNT